MSEKSAVDQPFQPLPPPKSGFVELGQDSLPPASSQAFTPTTVLSLLSRRHKLGSGLVFQQILQWLKSTTLLR